MTFQTKQTNKAVSKTKKPPVPEFESITLKKTNMTEINHLTTNNDKQNT